MDLFGIKLEKLESLIETGINEIKTELKDIRVDNSNALEAIQKNSKGIKSLENEQKETRRDLDVIRFFRRKKIVLIIVLFGLFKIYELIDIDFLYQKILKFLVTINFNIIELIALL